MPELVMPNVGEGVTEGTVTKWLKHEGDDVALDEPIVEIETDKAVVEIPSPFSGRLAQILVAEGETVPIGTLLARVEASAASEPPPRAQPPPPPVPAAPVPAVTPPPREAARAPESRRTRRYSPVVLKLADDHDIDLALVRGTGIDGRVTRQDVERYLLNPVANSAPPAEGAGVVGVRAEGPEPPGRTASGPPDAAPAGQPSDELTRLSATRRTIAAHMIESHRTIPSAWMTVEADVTALVRNRARRRADFERQEGVKLTYLPFFIQAAVAALKEHPQLNATFEGDAIRQHHDVHIGVAVATASGLLVPVLRNADELSLAGIARETARLGEKAHERKLTLEELRGATFTVDNTGAFGSVLSQPIVPVGQVAIVTTEAIRREIRPVGDGSDELFGVRSLINLCMSFDHRALDGAEAGRFMQAMKRHLEAVTVDS
jgi:2-oxoisovalerate dehydrogenase E2 component (dihydrolipoyl transacylase)